MARGKWPDTESIAHRQLKQNTRCLRDSQVTHTVGDSLEGHSVTQRIVVLTGQSRSSNTARLHS